VPENYLIYGQPPTTQPAFPDHASISEKEKEYYKLKKLAKLEKKKLKHDKKLLKKKSHEGVEQELGQPQGYYPPGQSRDIACAPTPMHVDHIKEKEDKTMKKIAKRHQKTRKRRRRSKRNSRRRRKRSIRRTSTKAKAITTSTNNSSIRCLSLNTRSIRNISKIPTRLRV